MALVIERPHHLPYAEAHRRVDTLAGELADELQLRHGWQGNRLVFKRSGIRGHIDLDDTHLRIEVHRSPWLPLSEKWLREQIEARLDELFPPPSSGAGRDADAESEAPPSAAPDPPAEPSSVQEEKPGEAEPPPITTMVGTVARQALGLASGASEASLHLARLLLGRPPSSRDT